MPTQERIKEIANQSFVTEKNQASFGVDKVADKPASGITTSDDAEARVKSINETISKIQGGIDNLSNAPDKTTASSKVETPSSSGGNPFAGLFLRINELQRNLTTAKENERVAREAFQGKDAESKLSKTTSSEEVSAGAAADLNAGVDAMGAAEQGGAADTSGVEDPVIRALADKTIANVGILNTQMNTLSQYREQFNEYTKQDIDSIARTAERSINRQITENDRVKRAMEFAGVVSGRAQFSPIIEESIINDVVQEGIDKIEVINEKKNTAIRLARKAEAEFNIDIFEQQAELAKEYNNEIESTISAMNAQVRQVEKDEREKIDFRQAQEERESLILAEQLADSTPEQVMEAAVANNIDPGLLMKAVGDAKFEKSTREFTGEEQKLTLEQKRASINQTNNAIRLANEKSKTEEKSTIPKDVEQGFRSVARLSKAESEDAWGDIQTFGLGDSVGIWLEAGLSKPQVKSMVAAHEQSQRQKVDDEMVPTGTEAALNTYIDNWAVEDNTPKPKYGGTSISSPETYFKK